jgi:hypothetical protein
MRICIIIKAWVEGILGDGTSGKPGCVSIQAGAYVSAVTDSTEYGWRYTAPRHSAFRPRHHARSKYRARSQLVTTASNLRCSVRKKCR